MARLGQVMQALPILEQGVAFARAGSHVAGFQFIALLLAEARLTAGKITEARELLDELRAVAQNRPFIMGSCEQMLAACRT